MAIDTVNLSIVPLSGSKALPDDSFARPKRNAWLAIRRGFSGHCPSCGKGALYSKYLKVNDRCAVCNTELFHQRADDAPPYLTILVVGHIIGAMMLSADTMFPDFPIVYQMILMARPYRRHVAYPAAGLQGRPHRLSMGVAHAWIRFRAGRVFRGRRAEWLMAS